MMRLQAIWHKYKHLAPELSAVLIALLFRLPLLNGSFWLDEAAQALESARPLSEQLNIISDFQPPLLHLMLHFAMYVSQAEWWLRTVGALIPGLITVWATYKIGEKIINKYVGFGAALLLATSSFHIFYSQELRPYSLPTMFAVLSWIITIYWKEYKPRNSLLLYAVLTALGLYSSYLYPFVLLAQFLYIVVYDRKIITAFISSTSLGILAFTPWMPMFLKQLEEGQYVRQAIPGWETVVSIPQLKALPLTLGKFMYGVVDLEFNAMYIFPSLLIIILLGAQLFFNYLKRKDETVRYIKIFTIWLTIPLLVSWLISFVVPVIRPKRLLFLLPVMYLYISAIVVPYITRRATSLRGGIAVLFVIVISLINLGGTLQYYSTPGLQRENWRDLYQQIIMDYPINNTVAVYAFPGAFAPMRWYNTESLAEISLGELHVNQVSNLPEQLKEVRNYDYVLTFDYLTDLTDPNDQVLATIKDFGYHEVDQLDYPNIGFVRVLTRKESITAQIQE